MDVCAQCTASSLNRTPAATCAKSLPRFCRPRLRLWRILIQSSTNPMAPKVTTASTTRSPERVNGTSVPTWPMQ